MDDICSVVMIDLFLIFFFFLFQTKLIYQTSIENHFNDWL